MAISKSSVEKPTTLLAPDDGFSPTQLSNEEHYKERATRSDIAILVPTEGEQDFAKNAGQGSSASAGPRRKVAVGLGTPHGPSAIDSGVDRLVTALPDNRVKELCKNALFAPGALKDNELVLELVDFTPHPIHKVPTYYFRMVHVDSGEELGTINLRVGSSSQVELYAGNVGYTVHPAHRGNRYAARSLQLLTSVASKLGFTPLWITCDPENIGSRRSCEVAGAQFVEIVAVPESCVIHRVGHKQKCRYRLQIGGID